MLKPKEICPVCKEPIKQTELIWLDKQTRQVMHFRTCSSIWLFAHNSVSLSHYKDTHPKEEPDVLQN